MSRFFQVIGFTTYLQVNHQKAHTNIYSNNYNTRQKVDHYFSINNINLIF
jgi:hypothetical protein